jgi:putative endonuclease
VAQYYVYILASRPHGALYIGMTSELKTRVWQHRTKRISGHTAKYDIDRLVYMESFETPEDAILAEKRLKKWNRAWKIELIEKANPDWRDLWESINA